MDAPKTTQTTTPEMQALSREEQKSLTHGEFWIPEDDREVYQRALRTLNETGIPYVVSGLYAIYEYTGIYRKTKDLDLFVEPRYVVDAATALRDVGFEVRLEQSHWIAKALMNHKQVDLIFGMGNGLAFIDAAWFEHSRAGILAGVPIRMSPAEDLIWHRLFVSERHRSDVADILHLILCRGDQLDWQRLLDRVQDHWRLLLGQIHLYDFVYPGHRGRIPLWLRRHLYALAEAEIESSGDPEVCQGTLISRFSYNIDVKEWGFRDLRMEATVQTRQLPIVTETTRAELWDGQGAPIAEDVKFGEVAEDEAEGEEP